MHVAFQMCVLALCKDLNSKQSLVCVPQDIWPYMYVYSILVCESARKVVLCFKRGSLG